MFYSTSINIPASTAKTSPVRVDLRLTHGVVTKVIVTPRPGHKALAHLTIHRGGFQLWPTNPDGDFHGDTDPISWEEHYELNDHPYSVHLLGWNEDDTYQHTFDVQIAVIPQWASYPYIMSRFLGQLVGILSPQMIYGGDE
jgi:hypothetical protein